MTLLNGSIYIEGGLIRNDVKKNNFSNILKFIFERYNSNRLIFGSDPFNLTNIRKGGFEFAVCQFKFLDTQARLQILFL